MTLNSILYYSALSSLMMIAQLVGSTYVDPMRYLFFAIAVLLWLPQIRFLLSDNLNEATQQGSATYNKVRTLTWFILFFTTIHHVFYFLSHMTHLIGGSREFELMAIVDTGLMLWFIGAILPHDNLIEEMCHQFHQKQLGLGDAAGEAGTGTHGGLGVGYGSRHYRAGSETGTAGAGTNRPSIAVGIVADENRPLRA